MTPEHELAEIRRLLLEAGAPDLPGSTLDLVKALVSPGNRVRLRTHPGDVPTDVLLAVKDLPSRLGGMQWSDATRTAIDALPLLVAEVGCRRTYEGACVRPALNLFTQHVETELTANDIKGGWERTPINRLLGHLCEEVAEVVESIVPKGGDHAALFRDGAKTLRRVALRRVGVGFTTLSDVEAMASPTTQSECADVGALAMIVSDRLGQLDPNGEILGPRLW